MATIEELQAELAQVSAAISAAYSGQSYEIDSGQSRRKLVRQSLDVLLKRKSQLEASIERSGGSTGIRHGVPMP